MREYDYIIVGSGCSGAIVAQTLVDAGKQVAMLDVGEANPAYQTTVPDQDYLSLRAEDDDQYKYMIGEDATGVVISENGKGAQITPPRAHMLRNVDAYIPMKSDTFDPIESLGYGGLGIGWGLQCWEFSRPEIAAVGLDVERTIASYERIAQLIGISGTADAAAPYTLGELKSFQPSPKMDRNMRRIHSKYLRHKARFDKLDIHMGRTPLALITQDKAGRRAYTYRDMDFYDDNGQSTWRPWMVVERLRSLPNFTYINGFLATHYSEDTDKTFIHGINPVNKQPLIFACKKLILATGALGTARIALRSQPKPYAVRTTLLCNPYTYVPCIQPALFGSGPERHKLGFGQLSAFLGGDDLDNSILTLYSYQSLMLFRVIRQAPLNFSDARPIMQYLSPGLVVTGIQHSDAPSERKFLQLKPNATSPTGDKIAATYELVEVEKSRQKKREDRYIKALRRVGLYAVKRMNPGHGSSVHYAGTIPFSDEDRPLTLSPAGRMHGTRNVYVADSSGFNFLPARGLTFTILANALMTAENVLHDTA